LAGLQSQYFPGNSGPLSLVTPSWAGAIKTGGFGLCWGETACTVLQQALQPGLPAYWLKSVK